MSERETRKPRLLVVDDEPAVQQLVSTVFTDEAELALASSAHEALELIERSGPFDGALIDKNLPDQPGLEVLRALKELAPDTEAIIMTAYASLDSAIAAIGLGAFDYIIKPFDNLEGLRIKMRNAVDKTRRTRERRQLLAGLAENEERYRQLFDVCAAALLVFDEDTEIVEDANRLALELYGYDRRELIGRPMSELRGAAGPGARTDRRRDRTEIAVEVTVAHFRYRGRRKVLEVVRPVRS
jgi:PAS domain S-box-containing protein